MWTPVGVELVTSHQQLINSAGCSVRPITNNSNAQVININTDGRRLLMCSVVVEAVVEIDS